MSWLWLPLAFLACLEGLQPPDTEMTIALLPAFLAVAVLGVAARGLPLFMAVLAPGFVGLFWFGMHGQAEMVWAPLYLGVLLAVYNLGCGRPLIVPVALSQLLIVTAPIPTLVGHLSWLALPAGAAGLALASLASLPYAGACEPR